MRLEQRSRSLLRRFLTVVQTLIIASCGWGRRLLHPCGPWRYAERPPSERGRSWSPHNPECLYYHTIVPQKPNEYIYNKSLLICEQGRPRTSQFVCTREVRLLRVTVNNRISVDNGGNSTAERHKAKTVDVFKAQLFFEAELSPRALLVATKVQEPERKWVGKKVQKREVSWRLELQCNGHHGALLVPI